MINVKHYITKLLLPLFIVCLPFFLAARYTESFYLRILAIVVTLIACAVYIFDLHRFDYDPRCKIQKYILIAVAVILAVFSFFIAAVSIEIPTDADEPEWILDYPLENSVNDYGCYPQMFDAFQKGQLNLDLDYDTTVLEGLENPYDPYERRQATGERFGPTWDRAYYEGNFYSYFGVAPIIFLYYPAYFLTGGVLSDALASAIMAAIASILMLFILVELVKRTEHKIPFLLLLLGGITLPCGALIWSTVTCANFYHIAVLSGITAVCNTFYCILKADSSVGRKRKMYFAFAGVSVAAIVASRPNLVLYMLIALPLLISIIIKRPHGVKDLVYDIVSFCAPMISLGILIMIYNAARFGSPFDFGSAYQLTLADTSTYSLSSALVLPAIYHFFLQSPSVDNVFPYIHPATRRMSEYAVERLVYTDKSVGAIFFPCTWGISLVSVPFRKNKLRGITALVALLTCIGIAIFDMCFGGVHLRYAADIMFVLTLLGVYLIISVIGNMERGSALRAVCYSVAVALFALTVLIEIPLIFDNERDMILKYHTEFYKSFLN